MENTVEFVDVNLGETEQKTRAHEPVRQTAATQAHHEAVSCRKGYRTVPQSHFRSNR